MNRSQDLSAKPVSVDAFAGSLVKSKLVTADEIKQLWRSIPAEKRPADGAALADLLIERSLLTNFQAHRVLNMSGEILVLGEYTLLDILGSGGMGHVYLARHQRMKRQVALKVLPYEMGDNADAVRRFEREVEAVAKLNHPNIVTAYDAGHDQSRYFLVMEYVKGQTLASYVRSVGRLSLEWAISCILQTARGLAYAHANGVIHRDIKPANLLLDDAGTLKILDLGLARLDDRNDVTELTKTSQVMGTVDFMSPEQARSSKSADARSDIYSLGITLWYVLIGKPPYAGETIIERLLAHQTEPVPSLSTSRSDVPAELDALFQRMVAKQPDERIQTMAEVENQLMLIQSQLQLASKLSPAAAINYCHQDDHQAPSAVPLLELSPNLPKEEHTLDTSRELQSQSHTYQELATQPAVLSPGHQSRSMVGPADSPPVTPPPANHPRPAHSLTRRQLSVGLLLLVLCSLVAFSLYRQKSNPSTAVPQVNTAPPEQEPDDGHITQLRERQLAEWVLMQPAPRSLRIHSEKAGQTVSVAQLADLPTENLYVQDIMLGNAAVNLTTEDFDLLCQSTRLETLTLVDVGFVDIDDETISAVVHSPSAATLHKLVLDPINGCNFSDAALLAIIDQLPKLSVLTISGEFSPSTLASMKSHKWSDIRMGLYRLDISHVTALKGLPVSRLSGVDVSKNLRSQIFDLIPNCICSDLKPYRPIDTARQ